MEGVPESEINKSHIEASSYYGSFIPHDFNEDPVKYFETEGIQIKDGDVKIDETGRVREDPTSVVDFPVWENVNGEKLQVVAKRVNTEKAQISRTQNPFYEYRVMQIVRHLNLPSPEPIAAVESDGQYIIIMEKVNGLRLVGSDLRFLRERLSDNEINNLKKVAEIKIEELKNEFLKHGIERKFKLTDMIFDIKFDSSDVPQIMKITPVDWERTKIDKEKLKQFIED